MVTYPQNQSLHYYQDRSALSSHSVHPLLLRYQQFQAIRQAHLKKCFTNHIQTQIIQHFNKWLIELEHGHREHIVFSFMTRKSGDIYKTLKIQKMYVYLPPPSLSTRLKISRNSTSFSRDDKRLFLLFVISLMSLLEYLFWSSKIFSFKFENFENVN